MELRYGAATTAETTFKKCARHPKGGVMCATCMKAGHTKASWATFEESQREKAAAPRVRAGQKQHRQSAMPGGRAAAMGGRVFAPGQGPRKSFDPKAAAQKQLPNDCASTSESDSD